MKTGPKPRDPVAFFQQSYRIDNDGCWIWTGPETDNGYGRFGYMGREVRAHRFSLQLVTGQLGLGLEACHHCDVPLCVNPAHLFWGTRKDNAEDAVRKGHMHNRFQAAKTHCPKGHEYTGQRNQSGSRICLICQAEKSRRYYWKNKR